MSLPDLRLTRLESTRLDYFVIPIILSDRTCSVSRFFFHLLLLLPDTEPLYFHFFVFYEMNLRKMYVKKKGHKRVSFILILLCLCAFQKCV